MTNSDEMYGTPGISDEDVLSTAASRVQDAAARGELPGEVLGVLTGQVPVKSMPVATGNDGLTDEERAEHLKAFNEGIGKRSE
jgi:hypothetical protein